MKRLLFTLAVAVSLISSAIARNTTTRVTQVTSAVTISTDVDYVITTTTPFTASGSINITNTEHAVVIFSKIRPSKAFDETILLWRKIRARCIDTSKRVV